MITLASGEEGTRRGERRGGEEERAACLIDQNVGIRSDASDRAGNVLVDHVHLLGRLGRLEQLGLCVGGGRQVVSTRDGIAALSLSPMLVRRHVAQGREAGCGVGSITVSFFSAASTMPSEARIPIAVPACEIASMAYSTW